MSPVGLLGQNDLEAKNGNEELDKCLPNVIVENGMFNLSSLSCYHRLCKERHIHRRTEQIHNIQ